MYPREARLEPWSLINVTAAGESEAGAASQTDSYVTLSIRPSK